jgi:hypothetical protein
MFFHRKIILINIILYFLIIIKNHYLSNLYLYMLTLLLIFLQQIYQI